MESSLFGLSVDIRRYGVACTSGAQHTTLCLDDIMLSLTVKISSVKIKTLDQIKVEKGHNVTTGDVVKETTDNNKVDF